MNDFENALRNLDKSVAELKHHRTEANEKPEFLSRLTTILEKATNMVVQVSEQIVSGAEGTAVERFSEGQIIDSNLDGRIKDLFDKIRELEYANKEKTELLNRLIIDRLPADGTVSDELNGYELKKDFYPLCENLRKSWENRFPCVDSTQREIDDFKEYLRLAFLRVSDEKVSKLKSLLSERYGKFIEEYDKFIDALYDPRRGGRIFGEFGLYLLDLNEEAQRKLFQEDGSYLDCVTLGGRTVKYYDDKLMFVTCKGEINYRHMDEFDVLFPGFCARCKNSDDILLLIPPYLYQRSLESPCDKSMQKQYVENRRSITKRTFFLHFAKDTPTL